MMSANGDLQTWLDTMKWDANGLVPAVVQDVQSKEMLMLAYMNRESLQLTIETGRTWFYSRSRQGLWNKGATSGHVQVVRELFYDCDADTLLVKVEQTGPACHTGKYSCFHQPISILRDADSAESEAKSDDDGSSAEGYNYGMTYFRQHGSIRGVDGSNGSLHEAAANAYQYKTKDRFAILSQLEQTIAERDAERPQGTYTTSLFEKGIDKILKKIGEEATEVVIAAKNRDRAELRYEVSDLLFHLLVLLREQRLPLDEVMRELAARHLRKPQ
jgi:phosphoribosyl-ATP pyrophosphohydrolase/phosphoribosyl-AMP cyclohydrolase